MEFPMKLAYGCLVSLALLSNCARSRKSEVTWEKNLPVIGSQSSPRAVDLNSDGVLDIVMGAGLNEEQLTDQGILAVDGRTGELLWEQKAKDQVYGLPAFYDITGDGTKDVFIGGRSPDLKAVDGKSGEIIWVYHYAYEKDPILQFAKFNFYNCQLVPDQNGDGLMDLLTANGGNSKAKPNSEENRSPGVLMLFDSKTGRILAADTMPDGGETYMSPLYFEQPGSGVHTLLFGTGGETINGNLYSATLSDLMGQKLSNAKVIAAEKGHGFIAPPVVADISGDGYYDIIAISHGSSVFAIDGKDHKMLWQQTLKGTESSNSFAVGYFTEDDVPDFFTFVSKGQWPENTGSLQVMLDGKDGTIVYMDSIGCTGFSSPVVYDLNKDGVDEAIISINEFDCSETFTSQLNREIENKLIYIDFRKRAVSTIDQQKGFKNIFSTPWIGDLDDDGYLDIVHCQYYSRGDLLLFLGMRIRSISTPVKIKEPPAWGNYMGSNGDGVFRLEDSRER